VEPQQDRQGKKNGGGWRCPKNDVSCVVRIGVGKVYVWRNLVFLRKGNTGMSGGGKKRGLGWRNYKKSAWREKKGLV